jgi:hypothetical protein
MGVVKGRKREEPVPDDRNPGRLVTSHGRGTSDRIAARDRELSSDDVPTDWRRRRIRAYSAETPLMM